MTEEAFFIISSSEAEKIEQDNSSPMEVYLEYPLFFQVVKNKEIEIKGSKFGHNLAAYENVVANLNMIFDYAIKYEIIDKNPVQFIELGKYVKVRKVNIFTQEEISILLKLKLMKNVDTILILIYTGLRINELLDLKKENVFIEERYIIAGSKTEAGKDKLIPL